MLGLCPAPADIVFPIKGKLYHGHSYTAQHNRLPNQPVVKGENSENRPYGAKAHRFMSTVYGTLRQAQGRL
jgi:hypothetical protein